jgi:hypothetical protein
MDEILLIFYPKATSFKERESWAFQDSPVDSRWLSGKGTD